MLIGKRNNYKLQIILMSTLLIKFLDIGVLFNLVLIAMTILVNNMVVYI